jgi:hypothetical protein
VESGHKPVTLARMSKRFASSIAALMLCSCSNSSSAGKQTVSGLLFVLGGDESVLVWNEHGKPDALIPDNQTVIGQLDKLTRSEPDCVGALYDATWVIGGPKEYRSHFGKRVTKTPLLSIVRADLTKRSEAELRPILHKADLSASGVCRSGAGRGATPMADTFVTGSRVGKAK